MKESYSHVVCSLFLICFHESAHCSDLARPQAVTDLLGSDWRPPVFLQDRRHVTVQKMDVRSNVLLGGERERRRRVQGRR